MRRTRRQRQQSVRHWLGLCLAALLAIAPPLNLAGMDLALDGQAESGVHAGHMDHGHMGQGHAGHDHSGLAHHASGSACLQCLVMGGMALAGAATAPDPTPELHAVAADWVLSTAAFDSRGQRILVCRGPPALA